MPQKAESVGESETGRKCEQSFFTTVDAGDVFMVSREDGEVALGTGATANLVCFSWLVRHNRILERRGIPGVTTYPSRARFRFGYGRHGEYATQQLSKWGSPEIRARSLRLRWKRIFQRYRVKPPRKQLADSWIFRAVR